MPTSKNTNTRIDIRVEDLISKLNVIEVKGALYSLFHHTRTESLANMVNGGSVWMSRIDQMNDGTEVFKDADRTYAFCLSAKPTENVGMWIAYGLPRRDAIRVRFSGKAIFDFINSSKGRVSVNPIDKDKRVLSQKILGTASLQYVGYVSRDGHRVHGRDGIYNIVSEHEMSREDLMNRCGSYIKRLGWAYEHEIRLVVRLDKKIDASRIQLKMPDVFEKLLTYKPRKKGDSYGMPSVIVGPWGDSESFKKEFLSKSKKLGCAEREAVRYFLSHTDDDGGLVRESEYKGEIRLGHCEECKRLHSCKCDYCEGEQK